FNTGMNTRFADNPVWLTEGIAMCAETWQADADPQQPVAGGINLLRQDQLRAIPHRRKLSIADLVGDDKRFVETRTAKESYAEAWALTYFLLETRPREFAAYLQAISKHPP